MIYPRCENGTSEYVNAEGYYFPCCWIASYANLKKLKNFLGDDYALLDAKKYNIKYIKSNNAIQKIKNSWNSDTPFSVCERICSKKKTTNINSQSQHYNINLEER